MDLNKPTDNPGDLPPLDSSPPPADGPADRDEQNWGTLAHLSSFVGLVLPFGNIIAPLAIWLTKGKESAYIGRQALEALNFQITVSISLVVAGLLSLILIGFLLIPIILVGDVVLVIMAAVAASKGEPYRYPWALRLVK